MADKPKSTAEKAAEEREKVRRLGMAFRAVFGADEEHRTEAQRMVWAQMERMGYARRPTMVPDANGAVCPLRMANAEGHRNFFQQIEELIRRASATDEKPKPEVLKENPPR